MLSTLTRKFCPLIYVALATISCGKKITDADPRPSRNTENQELPSAYVRRLDGSQASHKNYRIIENAQFKIPDQLILRAGSSNGKKVEILYDVNEYDSEDFQFKCIYLPSSNLAQMNLSKCVDYDNDDFGDISEQIFTLRKDELIQMRFTGAASADVVIEGIYTMKWI
jgi:hypothetical protein